MHYSDKIISPADGVQLPSWDRSLERLNPLQQGVSNPDTVSKVTSFGE